MTKIDDHEHRFWSLADPLLDRPTVTRSTMMGLPCLRVDGAFREWAAIPTTRTRAWRALLDEAHHYVSSLPQTTRRSSSRPSS